MIFAIILAVVAVAAVYPVFRISSHESRREETELWGYSKACDYVQCIGDCDRCSKNLPFGGDDD